jgi:ATP-binding cassette subfamily B protein
MIKLLCRLYEPTEGFITLNGINIKEYEYEEYLKTFAVVFQEFFLMALPIGQNLATALEYDPQQATAALEKAGFAERLKELEHGLDTVLYKHTDENGVNISGGEAQKIALARAIYKNAPFVVLDEPTAALDPIAEFEVYSKFNDLIAGKTAIFISHRLSSCRFCHRIAVFHQGEIIQHGTHEALLQTAAGKYHEMWHAQAQYYE